MSYIKREENRIEIGNDFISRSFCISNDSFKPEKIVNKRVNGCTVLSAKLGSEEFVIEASKGLSKKFRLKASSLKIDKINEFQKNGAALFEVSFKPAVLKKTEYNLRIIYVLLENDFFIKKQLYISAKGDTDVKIDYIDTESLILSENSQGVWSHPKMGKAFLDPYHSALGQPVYVNGLFAGSEFPFCDNDIVEKSLLRLRYYCGKSLKQLLNGKEEFVLHKSVFGAARSIEYETVRTDFLKYIETISQRTYLRTQYNSWYDHMLDISEENITKSFYEIEKGLTSNGVAPLNAYVVDDGWNDYEGDFWSFNSKFPNELYKVSALSGNFASEFGLWLGPRGGYDYQTKFAKKMQKAKKGGYNRQSRDICISDRNYLKNIEALFTDYINRFNIGYFKLDGFMLKPCKSKKHGHPTGGYKGMYTLTDAWENWLALIDRLREQRRKQGKELWVNLTCYAVPSPWLLKWVNSVWMQNSNDIGFTDKAVSGEALNGNDFDKMLTYRDSLYYDFHNVRMYQFPNSNIYNHEPIYGNSAKISMTNEEYRKYMYMLASRGTAFWELYYSYNLFSEDMWKINADVLKFVKENFNALKNSKLFGKSADEGEIYGYSAWNNNEGIIAFRNPSDKRKSYSLKLDEKVGVEKSIKDLTRVNVLPYCRNKCETLWSYGDIAEVEIEAHEIVIFKFSKPEESSPKLLGCKIIDENTVELCFDKHIVLFENSFKLENTLCIPQLEPDYRSVKLVLDKPVTAPFINVEYSVEDLYSNTSQGVVAVNNCPDGVITSSADKPCDITGEFTLEMTVNSTVKDAMIFSQGNALAVSLSNGKVRFNCCALKAVSDMSICDGKDKLIKLVREKNGMIKIYIDLKLSGSAYDEKIFNPVIPCACIKQSNSVKCFKFHNKALAFDEV